MDYKQDMKLPQNTNPFATVEYISPFDPSIDQEKSDLVQYNNTRDVKHLSFHKGQKPCVWFLKKLPYRTAQWFEDNYPTEQNSGGEQTTTRSRNRRATIAVSTCVHKYKRPDGSEVTLDPSRLTRNDDMGATLCDEDWIDEIAGWIGNLGVVYLGIAAEGYSTLPLIKKTSSG